MSDTFDTGSFDTSGSADVSSGGSDAAFTSGGDAFNNFGFGGFGGDALGSGGSSNDSGSPTSPEAPVVQAQQSTAANIESANTQVLNTDKTMLEKLTGQPGVQPLSPQQPMSPTGNFQNFHGTTPNPTTPAPPVTADRIDAAMSSAGVSLPWYAPASTTQNMASFINGNPGMNGEALTAAAQKQGLTMNPQQQDVLTKALDAARAPITGSLFNQPGITATAAPTLTPEGAGTPTQAAAAAPVAPVVPPTEGATPGRFGLPAGMQLNSDAAWSAYANRTVQMESNFNPNAVTGSYKGYGQWSNEEIARHQSQGRLTDPNDLQQTRDALIADGKQRAATLQANGLPVTPGNVYLMHQQGVTGLQTHLRNPDAPAWQNMAQYAPRGSKDPNAWGKQAIWGNMTPEMKAQYPGGVDSVTSRGFVTAWNDRFNGTPGATNAVPAAGTQIAQKSAPAPAAPAQPGQTVTSRLKDWAQGKPAMASAAPTPPQNDVRSKLKQWAQQKPASTQSQPQEADISFTPQPVQFTHDGVTMQGGKVYFVRNGQLYDQTGAKKT